MFRFPIWAAQRTAQIYNHCLDTHPIKTKALTSGVIFAGGDVIAQKIESNQDGAASSDSQLCSSTDLNWKRVGIFFVFGTVVAGPAFHYWYNNLDTLPVLLWSMKQSKQRSEILRAYTLLRSHGIDVKLDMSKIPDAKKTGKWTSKFAMIAADQMIFATTYSLVFFLYSGLAMGALEKLENESNLLGEGERKGKCAPSGSSEGGVDEYSGRDSVCVQRGRGSTDDGSSSGGVRHSDDSESSRRGHESWAAIWDRTWTHTKAVYWQTLLADYMFWPPLQLINFSFVPVRYQFLYVNVATLGWNAFLSLMANKKS